MINHKLVKALWLISHLWTAILFVGCSSRFPAQNPVGRRFPTVSAEKLSKVSSQLPDEFAGQPVVVLVGYIKNSQFDIDRWILGLMQSGAKIRIVEVPTISGLAPKFFKSNIDEGMRSGIPKEDWPSVMTVYDDSDILASFLGNENPNNARVLLLNSTGEVIWFHDRGYSASTLLELVKMAGSLQGF